MCFFQANKVAVTTMPSTIRPSIIERRPSSVSNIVWLLHVLYISMMHVLVTFPQTCSEDAPVVFKIPVRGGTLLHNDEVKVLVHVHVCTVQYFDL